MSVVIQKSASNYRASTTRNLPAPKKNITTLNRSSLSKPDFQKLSEPFGEGDVYLAIGAKGISAKSQQAWAKLLTYLKINALQDRLNLVLGFDGWQSRFTATSEGVVAELAIKLGGEWVLRSSFGAFGKDESAKATADRALCRAATAWGIGRELYDLPTRFVDFVGPDHKGSRSVEIDGNNFFYVLPTEMSLETSSSPMDYLVPHRKGTFAGRYLSELSDSELSDLEHMVGKPDAFGISLTIREKIREYRSKFSKTG